MTETAPNFVAWHRGQIDLYARQEFPVYSTYAKALRGLLEGLCGEVAPLAIVQSRAKSVSSFAGKAARKWPLQKEPLRQLTDLCGARVITVTQQEMIPIRRFIEERFNILESEDVSSRLGSTEFGYASFHYILTPMPQSFEGAPAELGSARALFELIGQRRAEIQVRTLMQHAWASVTHDRLYKTTVDVPPEWLHETARQAALLENADREFSRIVAELDGYLEHHDAYMGPERLQAEIDTLGVILANEPRQSNKPGVALQIARLARARRAWKTVIEVLEPYAAGVGGEANGEQRAILLELGQALCRADPADTERCAQGRRHLELVARPAAVQGGLTGSSDVEPDPVRARALACLAQLHERNEGSDRRSQALVESAVALDPGNPYLLASVVQHEVLSRGDLSPVGALRTQIRAALATCAAHARLGIELPAAHLTRGRLFMLLGQPDDGFAAYARAVPLADVSILDEELVTVRRLLGRLSTAPAEMGWLERFLLLARLGRLWETAPDEARQAVQGPEFRAICGSGVPPLTGPVIILAGGTDPAVEQHIAGYRPILQQAFAGFRGTLVSGGTRAGIAGIAGDLAEFEPGLTAVAYLPRHLPVDAPRDPRYRHLLQSGGETLSPLEPLQCWTDLLGQGMPPSEVRVIGINGGRIAAFEYGLALALGATVGLIENSGRAAAELLPDAEHWPPGRLLRLPDDPMTLRAFVVPAPPPIEAELLEAAGRAAHGAYVAEIETQQREASPPWESTRPEFRESSRQQALYAASILAREGYRVAKLRAGYFEPDFTDEQVERMAEMEHGRWNVERLRAGWRYGPTKDIDRRISPYLAPWWQLEERIRDIDRRAIRNYPGILRQAGLGIYREG